MIRIRARTRTLPQELTPERLTLRCQRIPCVMDFDVLVVVRLGRGSFATNVTRERPFTGVYPFVLR